MRHCLALGAMFAVFALAACSSATSDSPATAAQTETVAPAIAEPTIAEAATAEPIEPEATLVPEPTPPPPTATPEPTAEPTLAPEASCVTVANFDSADTNAEWIVVNDNVMGGRSLGDRSFTEQTMVFAGAINTNGGGFSSLRLPLPTGILAQADRVTFRGRSDGRTYMLTFDDALEGRNRRVSFRAPLEFTTVDEWETVTVYFDDLWPAIFGQRVEADAFRPELATRIGIMLSDGTDGDFVLEVDQIQACEPAP